MTTITREQAVIRDAIDAAPDGVAGTDIAEAVVDALASAGLTIHEVPTGPGSALEVVTEHVGVVEDAGAEPYEVARDVVAALEYHGYLAASGDEVVSTARLDGALDANERTVQALRESDAMVTAVLDLLDDRGARAAKIAGDIRDAMRAALDRVRRDFVAEHEAIAGRLS